MLIIKRSFSRASALFYLAFSMPYRKLSALASPHERQVHNGALREQDQEVRVLLALSQHGRRVGVPAPDRRALLLARPVAEE